MGPMVFGLLALGLSGSAITGITRHRSEAEAETLARPAPQVRAASAVAAAADLGVLRPEIQHTSFWLIGSPHPIVAQFSGRADDFSLTLQDPQVYAGLATAVTEDGYLVTAAHMVRPFMCVIGWSEGRQTMVSVRLVKVVTDRHVGAECAILKADHVHLSPRPWGAIGGVGQKLFASGQEFEREFRRIELTGQVTGWQGAAMTTIGRVVPTDLPFYHGDSGGGVFDSDGRLVGLITVFWVPWDAQEVSRLVFVPDQHALATWIDADRSRGE